ncbi:hypothetical protein [Arthrobacter sp. ISL-30]|nr:hypothetical protein [Arthrobacter sp. ISL-30]
MRGGFLAEKWQFRGLAGGADTQQNGEGTGNNGHSVAHDPN